MTDLFHFTASDLSAISLSLKVAVWSSVIALPFAIAIGWFLARNHFRGKALLEGVIHLPLVLPPVVTGYLLLIILGTNGIIGKWLYDLSGIRIAFSFYAALLASVVVSFPLITRSIRLAIELVDVKYEEAARTLGASRLKTFLSVTLPMASPGIISGFVLGFARSLGEFGATITFAGNIEGETQTLPLAVFSYMQVPGQDSATFRLVMISVLLSLLAMIVAEFLNRRAIKRSKK